MRIGTVEIGDFPLLLAPMEDVSDPPFRAACKQHGADLMFTEFISANGLLYDAQSSIQKLDIYPEEQPIGIQIFGDEIEPMRKAAEIVERTQPDILDINYGCPVKKVACKGAGAGILKDLDKMQRMTEAIVKQVSLPVTVKTRLGWDHNTILIQEVAKRLQDVGIQALSIHGRTRAQMYKGEADWSYIAEVKNDPSIHIPIFGNGDIDSPQKALEYRNKFGVDGIMIGRAAIGYPWIFQEIKHYFNTGEILPPPTIDQRIEVCKTHLRRSLSWKGEKLGIVEMRRHYTNYFRGLPGIKTYRNVLVQSNDVTEIEEVFEQIRETYQDHREPALSS